MNVFISYFTDDKPQMVRWANHVNKLGGCRNHNIFILPAHGASVDGVIEPLNECFASAEVVECFHSETGWPISCNRAFEMAAWHSYNHTKQSFLWMEPDAVPLVSTWLDDIEAAYKTCGKPFMGDFVKIAGVMPNGIDHMSGIAVYHWDMPRLAASVFNNDHAAWDIVSGREVVPQMHKTNLIHHDWVPTKQWRREKVDASCVRTGAVIYHPDKQGVLMGNNLAEVGNRAKGEPSTGACGDAASFEQPPSAPTASALTAIREFLASETPLEECHALMDSILILVKNHKHLKKIVIKRLNEEGIIKATKAKKRKQPRAKVQAALAAS